MWNNEKKLKVDLWDTAVYLKLSFNNVYKSWVGLVSPVFSLLTTSFSKIIGKE